MNTHVLRKKLTNITLRQIIYIAAGLYFLVIGIMHKDWAFGIVALLFLYQGIFNTCLWGSCRVPRRR